MTTVTLTNMEKWVYSLAISGKTNKEIATECNIVLQTAKFHMTNILRKHGVKSRAQLLAARIS